MKNKINFKADLLKTKNEINSSLKKIGSKIQAIRLKIANFEKSIIENKKLRGTLYVLRPVFAALVILCTFLVGGVMGIGLNLASLQDVRMLRYYVPNETTFIYDDKGAIMARLHDEENRIVVPLYKIPRYLKQAVMAIEDNRFYSHTGVDLFGIVRAMKHNIEDKSGVEGGSTLTQQLAKNLFLTPERSISRKLAEAWIATQIEKYYTKDEILELYLNQVYWGHNAYGVEGASQTYFGKSVTKLTLEEAALLAGLLRAPENFSPFKNLKLAKWRQKLVLSQMAHSNYITIDDAQLAAKKPLKLARIKYEYKHPYFTTYVIDVLSKKYGMNNLRLNGLKVYTTINTKWQTYAEQIFPDEIKALRGNNVEQGALVSLDPRTGHVKAMIGGVDFKQSQFNRAFQAQRQPGSSFKPYTYLTAFAMGFSPSDGEIDGPVTFGTGDYSYSPKNYGGNFSGAMTLRTALVRSVNVVAVKLLAKVGIQNVINTARALGITSDLPPYLSLTLGAASVTPLEMASAYGVFAAGGLRVPPTPILYITDRYGKIIEDNRKPKPVQVFNKDAIAILVNVLKDVPVWGTAYAARLSDRVSAGKTGTAESHKDVWYMGFVPQLVTAVWIGNDKPEPMWGATGGGFCAPIWRKFMEVATKGMPVMKFPEPTSFRIKTALKNDEKKEFTITESSPSPSSKPSASVKAVAAPKPEISFAPLTPDVEPGIDNSGITPGNNIYEPQNPPPPTNAAPPVTQPQPPVQPPPPTTQPAQELDRMIEDLSNQ